MSIDLIQEIAIIYNIPIIEKRNYWFVRTLGGDFYLDFTMNNYIAIGWDYVNLNEMKPDKDPLIVRKKIEINEIHERPDIEFDMDEAEESEDDSDSKKKTKISKIYNKINSFVNEMCIGDIVLIPSPNSDRIAIGIVKSDAYENTEYFEQFMKDNADTMTIPCPYHKRRDVQWVNAYPKEKLDIYLQNAIKSQQALSSLNEYADLINRNIYEIYLSGNKMHSIIRTEQHLDFTLADLKLLTDFIYDSYAIVGQYPDTSFANDLKIKINVNSPLLMQISIAVGIVGLATMPLLAIFSAYKQSKYGGKMEFKKFKWETKGSAEVEIEQEHIKLKQQQMELITKLLDDPQFQEKLEAIDKMGVIMPDINFENR
ncbi:MAG: hypothetical protein PHV56_05720 [Clostridia bacterium]|nr:hypothetical protein [Clostridia bacterium]